MSFANYQTTADPHLLNPADSSTPGLLHGGSSNFDRSILGIPAAEDDEYTRGLTFFFDPSTGQPSVASTSEESDNPGEASPYEASPSSNNTGSRRVFTPKSVSDTSGGLHPLLLSSASVGSSDGGWSDGGADHPHPPSVSARASAGSSQVASMPMPTQTPTLLPTSGKYGASTMSPEAVDPRIAQPFSPLEDMSDPRGIINIDQNDVNFLVGILSPEDQSRQGDSAQALDPMDLMDNQSSQGIAPQTGKHTGAVTARTPGASRRWQNPWRRRATTKDVTEKAKSTENQKLMRLLGSCLPCLVNHEKVRL